MVNVYLKWQVRKGTKQTHSEGLTLTRHKPNSQNTYTSAVPESKRRLCNISLMSIFPASRVQKPVSWETSPSRPSTSPATHTSRRPWATETGEWDLAGCCWQGRWRVSHHTLSGSRLPPLAPLWLAVIRVLSDLGYVLKCSAPAKGWIFSTV